MEAEEDPDDEGLFSVHFCDMILIILGNPLFRSARKPYVEPMLRHNLGPMNVRCPSCGALHFAAERVSGSSKRNPRFQVCCADGKVQLPLLQPPLAEPLHNLLTSNDRAAVNFCADIWKYNRALSFTLLGVKEDRSVNKGNGPPVFRPPTLLYHIIYPTFFWIPADTLPHIKLLPVAHPLYDCSVRPTLQYHQYFCD